MSMKTKEGGDKAKAKAKKAHKFTVCLLRTFISYPPSLRRVPLSLPKLLPYLPEVLVGFEVGFACGLVREMGEVERVVVMRNFLELLFSLNIVD